MKYSSTKKQWTSFLLEVYAILAVHAEITWRKLSYFPFKNRSEKQFLVEIWNF